MSPSKLQAPVPFVVRRRPGNPQQGLFYAGDQVFPCALGRGGTTVRKREGDGATPATRMRVLYGYFRADRLKGPLPPTQLPLQAVGDSLGWCDASGDRNYNRPVRLPYPASHEKMRREDRLYDICIVLDWNMRPAVRGRGSAIFLHIARPGFLPTEGCIAVSPRTMHRLLPLLTSESTVTVLR